jgi:hypothetical protein
MSPIAASLPTSSIAKATTAAAVSATKASAVRTALDEHSNTGEFKRRDAAWRNWVSSEGMYCMFMIDRL